METIKDTIKDAIDTNHEDMIDYFISLKDGFYTFILYTQNLKFDKYLLMHIKSYIKPIPKIKLKSVSINHISPKYLSQMFILCNIDKKRFYIRFNDDSKTSLFLYAIEYGKLELIKIMLENDFNLYDFGTINIFYSKASMVIKRNTYIEGKKYMEISPGLFMYRLENIFPNIKKSSEFIYEFINR
jgi:hypothetical protein